MVMIYKPPLLPYFSYCWQFLSLYVIGLIHDMYVLIGERWVLLSIGLVEARPLVLKLHI